MRSLGVGCLVAVAGLQAAVPIESVFVGDANNPADTSGSGSVPYTYYLAKQEVNNTQYATFLNAKAQSDPTGLYNLAMASWGISRSGVSGTYTYSVNPGWAAKPVNYVSFFDAARFSNWVMNGASTSADTESGFYTFGGPTTILSQADRNGGGGGADWVAVASDDEWYKGAYYDAVSGSYSMYPMGDLPPEAVAPPGGANSANFNSVLGTVTDGGAYTLSLSAYGTVDQAGNVWEWTDAMPMADFHTVRGGAFDDGCNVLACTFDGQHRSDHESESLGFRVSSSALIAVPEPSVTGLSVGLTLLALGLGRRWRGRRRP